MKYQACATILSMGKSGTPLIDRVMARVVVHADGCWHWTGCLSPEGYATLTVRPASIRPHRWLYEYTYGPVPGGLVLDHTCHNIAQCTLTKHACLHRRCVNPDHLEPVTQSENLRRARRSECVNGHSMTDDNTYYAPSTPEYRRCVECRRNSVRSWRRRQAELTDFAL